LKDHAAEASTAADHKGVAQASLAMAYRAVLDSQAELARRLTMLALTAARKAKAAELKNEAALLLIELEQPISDGLRAKARQFLNMQKPTTSRTRETDVVHLV